MLASMATILWNCIKSNDRDRMKKTFLWTNPNTAIKFYGRGGKGGADSTVDLLLYR